MWVPSIFNSLMPIHLYAIALEVWCLFTHFMIFFSNHYNIMENLNHYNNVWSLGALENYEPALVRGAPSTPSTRARIGFGCRPLHLRLWCPSSLPLLAHVEDFFPACGPNTGSHAIGFGELTSTQCSNVTLLPSVTESESFLSHFMAGRDLRWHSRGYNAASPLLGKARSSDARAACHHRWGAKMVATIDLCCIRRASPASMEEQRQWGLPRPERPPRPHSPSTETDGNGPDSSGKQPPAARGSLQWLGKQVFFLLF